MSTPDRKPDLSGQTQTSGGPSPDAEFRELWAALRLIRETVEELAPPGSVPNDEYLGPEPMLGVKQSLAAFTQSTGPEADHCRGVDNRCEKRRLYS